MKIVLHLERVVLHGLPLTASQLPAVRTALEGELVRLFRKSAPAHLAHLGSVRQLVASSPFTYHPGQRPASIGNQLARAVHAVAHGPPRP